MPAGAFARGLVSHPDSGHSMTVLASVDDYLPEAGALDKALLPLGFVLAFCAQHGLLSQTFLQHRGEQLSSVRLQEGPVTALFAVHGGTLYASDFSPQVFNFCSATCLGCPKTLPNFLARTVTASRTTGQIINDWPT